MYHGTDYSIEEFDLAEENPSSGRFDICLTDCESIAEMYATRYDFTGDGTPTILQVEIAEGLVIATQEEALLALGHAIEDIRMMGTSDTFHAIDQSGDALVAAGFDGVTYLDCLPGTAEEFECTRIYKGGAVKIVKHWEV